MTIDVSVSEYTNFPKRRVMAFFADAANDLQWMKTVGRYFDSCS